MSKCRNCNQDISWGKHPQSGKPIPLNSDGSIHFATCSKKKEERFTSTKKPNEHVCFSCGAPYLGHCWAWYNEEQIRLRIFFKCHHMGFLLTEISENIDSINYQSEIDLHLDRQKFSKYSLSSYVERVKELGEAKFAENVWVKIKDETHAKALIEKGHTTIRYLEDHRPREMCLCGEEVLEFTDGSGGSLDLDLEPYCMVKIVPKVEQINPKG